MALPTTISFGKFRIYVEDPAVPDAFVAPCGLSERSLALTKNTNEVILVDCADEDAPASIERDIVSLDWNVNGNGVLASETYEMWKKFSDAGVPWRIRIEIELPAPVGLKKYIGKAILTNVEFSAVKGNRVPVTVQIAGAGKLADLP